MDYGCIFCNFHYFPKLNQKVYSGTIIEHRYAKVHLHTPQKHTGGTPSHHLTMLTSCMLTQKYGFSLYSSSNPTTMDVNR